MDEWANEWRVGALMVGWCRGTVELWRCQKDGGKLRGGKLNLFPSYVNQTSTVVAGLQGLTRCDRLMSLSPSHLIMFLVLCPLLCQHGDRNLTSRGSVYCELWFLVVGPSLYSIRAGWIYYDLGPVTCLCFVLWYKNSWFPPAPPADQYFHVFSEILDIWFFNWYRYLVRSQIQIV